MKDSVCFRARKQKQNIYHFQPYKCLNKSISEFDFIDLYDYGKDFETKFSTSQMAAEAKRSQLYFFYLCNDHGFDDNESDYTINIFNGCYYRSTPFLEFQKTTKKSWSLKTIDPDHNNLVNQEEVLSFSRKIEDLEKVYILVLSSSDKKTVFMHYSVNKDQKNDVTYNPPLFEKEMPSLVNRPNFSLSNRDRLLDRFDSWLILS